MEYRHVGDSGLVVSALSFGTATFGGGTPFFSRWGTTGVAEATRLVDVALDAGVTLFDTADSYSDGLAEEFLGQAIGGRRGRLLLATKANSRSAPGPNGLGSPRHHLIGACEASLRRLRTDHIDLYQLHGFDALSPVEETLRALDDLVRGGKVRYIGCSNFSGWHLMKSLAISEKLGLARHIAHQAFYSLIAREYEWELLPLAIDQGIGTLVWSPLAGGRLTGKVRRGQPPPEATRLGAGAAGELRVPEEHLYGVLDALDAVAAETGRTLSQIALRWLLQRPTVATVIVRARGEEQLRENLGAAGWALTADQLARLDAASAIPPVYPYWHQRTAGWPATRRRPSDTPPTLAPIVKDRRPARDERPGGARGKGVAMQTWEVWYPDAGATGLLVARGRLDPTGILWLHAAPPTLAVAVRDDVDRTVARGEGLERVGERLPMTRLWIAGDAVRREDRWPAAADLGQPVLLPGGEVGILTAWWHAPDGGAWRWSVEFFNRR